MAGTVAHDCHNIIVAGVNDADMAVAATALMTSGGGFVVVRDGHILAQIRLAVAGLMSDAPLDLVTERLEALDKAYREVAGPAAAAHPFMSLSFLSLEVVPALRLTDQGLVDVTGFRLVDPFV